MSSAKQAINIAYGFNHGLKPQTKLQTKAVAICHKSEAALIKEKPIMSLKYTLIGVSIMNTEQTTNSISIKRALPLLGAFLFFAFFLLLSCDDIEDDDPVPGIVLGGADLGDGLQLGDEDITLKVNGALKGVENKDITWTIESKYGSISAAGVYKATKVWKDSLFVKGTPIKFTIKAESKQDSNIAVEQGFSISTKSFPNPLKINSSNRMFYSNWTAGDMDRDLVVHIGVTKISDYAFRNQRLTSVIIPESVTLIKENAFANNNLSRLVLPASVKSLEISVFKQNVLTDVSILSPSLSYFPTVPPFIENGADMSVTINAILWQRIKDNPTLFNGARVIRYTDLAGNNLLEVTVDASPPRAVGYLQ